MANVYPNNLEDVISFIHRLYTPGVSAEEVRAVQDVLQQIQRSPEGWNLGNSLLGRQDDQYAQFFGSLTFTVKLNSDWQSLPEDDIPILRDRLIDWFVKLVNQRASQMVLKKMCSTLVVFFIRFPQSFPHSIRHLVCCLYSGSAQPVEKFAGMPDSYHLYRSMSDSSKLAALLFATMLVEEVGKIEVRNSRSQEYHLSVYACVDEAVCLIRDAIGPPEASDVQKSKDQMLVDTGLKTFQAWAFYSLRASIEADLEIPALKSLTQYVIGWLGNEEHFDTACEVIVDVLSQSYAFFNPDDNVRLVEILVSPWAVERYQALISSDADEDALQFGKLLVTFAEATVQKLAETLDMPHGRAIIDMMHGLLTVPGYPRVDEEISGSTFEFWGGLADYVYELPYQSDEAEPSWANAARHELKLAVEGFWKKIRMPDGHEVLNWLKDQRDGFLAYRRDVADLVESTYGCVGSEIFIQLVDQVVGSLAGKQHTEIAWGDVEASLFCINSLSSTIGDAYNEDPHLERLFGSTLFSILAEAGEAIPIKARMSSVNIIGSYAAFFERQTKYLPSALNFLFTCLSASSLTSTASRSISALCSACRGTLSNELPIFLQQYALFTSAQTNDDSAKERVLCAISYVIQALPSDELKLEPIAKLLVHIENDAQTCAAYSGQGRVEEAKEVGLLVLRSLICLGKGLQAEDDVPIDLDAGKMIPVTFWIYGPGSVLQRRILSLVRTLCSAFPGSGELVDTACGVLKTGFTETSGLFCFLPEEVTSFLLDHSWRTETVLSTASIFISSQSIEEVVDLKPHVLKLLQRVDEFVVQLENPHGEPTIAQSILEFLDRVLRHHVDVLVHFQPEANMERLFLFALNALSASETLVKRAAALFWSSFMALANLEPAVQSATDSVVVACGPRLAEKLLWAIGGGCQRSEVEVFTDPLRKMVTRQVKAKAWLSTAMAGDILPSAKVTGQEKQRFIDQVISLRGRKNTNQVAKEFWLKCRGTEFAYAS